MLTITPLRILTRRARSRTRPECYRLGVSMMWELSATPCDRHECVEGLESTVAQVLLKEPGPCTRCPARLAGAAYIGHLRTPIVGMRLSTARRGMERVVDAGRAGTM